MEPSYVGYAAVLLASLTGSLHCAGMCGGFVAVYSSHPAGVLPHVAYNLGRLVTYVLLGVAAGFFGRAVDAAGSMAGFQNLASFVVGLLMVGWGMKMLTNVRFPRGSGWLLECFSSPFISALRVRESLRPIVFAAILGLLSTFLPCGFLYGFVLMAAGTADPMRGGVLMGLFWLGTVPIMALLGGSIRLLSARLLRLLPRLAAILILFAGFYSLAWHISVGPGAGGSKLQCPHHTRAIMK